jgi:hypothetical protein
VGKREQENILPEPRDYFQPAETHCEQRRFLILLRCFFRLALPLLKLRVPITAMHSWILCVARNSGGVELRRRAGRTGWPGQAQFKHTMKKL